MPKLKYVMLLMLIGYLFTGCIGRNAKNETTRGKNTVHFDLLEQIMYDIHIADAMITTNVIGNNNSKVEGSETSVYNSIFEKYSCTKEQIDETLLYYTYNNLDSLDLLYDKVLEKLSVESINIK